MKRFPIILVLVLVLLGCWPSEPRESQPPSATLNVFKTPVDLKEGFIRAFREHSSILYEQTLHDQFEFHTTEFPQSSPWNKTDDIQYTERIFIKHLFPDLSSAQDTALIFTFHSGFTAPPDIDSARYENVVYSLCSNIPTRDTIQGRADIIVKFVDNSWMIKEWNDAPLIGGTTLACLKIRGELR